MSSRNLPFPLSSTQSNQCKPSKFVLLNASNTNQKDFTDLTIPQHQTKLLSQSHSHSLKHIQEIKQTHFAILNSNPSISPTYKNQGKLVMEQKQEKDEKNKKREKEEPLTYTQQFNSNNVTSHFSSSSLDQSSLSSKFFRWVSDNRDGENAAPFAYDDPIWNAAFQSTLKKLYSSPESKFHYQKLYKCVFSLYSKTFEPSKQNQTPSSSSSTSSLASQEDDLAYLLSSSFPSTSTSLSSSPPDHHSFTTTHSAVFHQLLYWYHQCHTMISSFLDPIPDAFFLLSDMTKKLASFQKTQASYFIDLAVQHAQTAFSIDPRRGQASAKLGILALSQTDSVSALYFLLRAACSFYPANTTDILHSYFMKVFHSSSVSNRNTDSGGRKNNKNSSSSSSSSSSHDSNMMHSQGKNTNPTGLKDSIPFSSTFRYLLSKIVGNLYTKTSLDDTPHLIRELPSPFTWHVYFLALFLEYLTRSVPQAHPFAMHFVWACFHQCAQSRQFLPLCLLSWHLHHLSLPCQEVPGQDEPLAIAAFVQLCDFLNTPNEEIEEMEMQLEEQNELQTKELKEGLFRLDGLACWSPPPWPWSIQMLKSWWRASPCQGQWVHMSQQGWFVATLGQSWHQLKSIPSLPSSSPKPMTFHFKLPHHSSSNTGLATKAATPTNALSKLNLKEDLFTLTYVLDTNTLLSEKTLLTTSLPILVPLVVLMELKGLAKSTQERTAKYALRALEFIEKANVPLYTSKGFRVTYAFEEAKQPSSADNLILETCSNLLKKSFRIMLVTEDINLRLKSQGWKIPVTRAIDVFGSHSNLSSSLTKRRDASSIISSVPASVEPKPSSSSSVTSSFSSLSEIRSSATPVPKHALLKQPLGHSVTYAVSPEKGSTSLVSNQSETVPSSKKVKKSRKRRKGKGKINILLS